jgi:trigger factor
MEVILKSAEGLGRNFAVKVPAAEIHQKLDARLEGMRPRLQIKGFRKGKAPMSYLRKVYGRGVMGEIVNDVISESAQKAFADHQLQPAAPPRPTLTSDLDAVLAGKSDLEYEIVGEILPTFEPMDLATLELVRLVSPAPAEDVEKTLEELAERRRQYEPRGEGEAAGKDDLVSIDYTGLIDDKPFQNNVGVDQEVVLGSNRLIPGFEDQLIGARAGETRTVNVTFPDEYAAVAVAGKAATFAVTVKEVKAPQPIMIDDELAKSFGFDDLAALRARVTERLDAEHGQASRMHLKRALLDKLDAAHSFDLPPGMVEQEFQQIWRQVEAAERDEDEKDKSEDELRADYRKIAERRVKLGLLLAEIGKRANVSVPSADLQRAVQERAMMDARILQNQGQKVTPQDVLKFYQQNPGAIAEIRAPLFEEQVVDHILAKATITEQVVSKEELFKDPDGEIVV